MTSSTDGTPHCLGTLQACMGALSLHHACGGSATDMPRCSSVVPAGKVPAPWGSWYMDRCTQPPELGKMRVIGGSMNYHELCAVCMQSGVWRSLWTNKPSYEQLTTDHFVLIQTRSTSMLKWGLSGHTYAQPLLAASADLKTEWRRRHGHCGSRQRNVTKASSASNGSQKRRVTITTADRYEGHQYKPWQAAVWSIATQLIKQ